ncbi:hypothetical protein ACSCBZ_09285 [Streptomyces niveiscabiei]|uniref:hypothetical protein n=1 Tax=Streptomyces niveiscabiei TaxID=164115 RepID=UPI0006EB3F83|nr:hypothetical protein [Streptomyces niveiscabiei]
MRTRLHAAVLTALSAACLTVVTATAVPAATNPAPPGFLAAGDLPPYLSSPWTAGPVTAGVPEEVEEDTCLGKALSGGGTWSRTFRTDLDAGAWQVSVVLPDETQAKGRYARIVKDVRSCAERIEQKYPDIQAEFKDYGAVQVEEGAHVFGLHTAAEWGALDVRLLGVGRDGRTVTVVDWGQMGTFKDAPVKAFKKTTVTAVNKLR